MTPDTQRAAKAATEIINGRDLQLQAPEIFVTLETMITLTLLSICRDPKHAAAMLNEGLVPRIEERLIAYQNRKPS